MLLSLYRAKTTIHEFKNKDNRAYDYKITEVELIISGSSTSNALNSSTSVSATKILNGVEKSYDKGKKVLEKSKNNTRFSRSYHGGSANFNKFDLSHVLSGLGANVSGYGIYLIDTETSARDFASVASKKNADKFAKDSQYMQDLYAEAERINDKRNYVKEFIYSEPGKGAEITKWLYDLYHDSPVYNLVSDYRKGDLSDIELEEKLSEHVSRDEVFDIISKIRERDNYEANQKLWYRVYDKFSQDYNDVMDKYNFANRHLYSVEIPDDNGENYLHYGRPMPKEQYDRVRRALLNWKGKNNKDNKMSYIINNAISKYDDKMSNGTKFDWHEMFSDLGSPEGKWLSDALRNEGLRWL